MPTWCTLGSKVKFKGELGALWTGVWTVGILCGGTVEVWWEDRMSITCSPDDLEPVS